MDRAYLAGSRALGAILCVVGVALVATTLLRGGGPLALGVVVGLLFAALGVARMRLARLLASGRGP